MSQRFGNKVVIVTGGAAGIGLATARRFLSEGANVVIGDLHEDQINRALEDLNAGESAYGQACDVGNQSQAESLVSACIERYGKVDVLVNNAGAWALGFETPDITNEQWDAPIRVNLTGAFYFARACIPHMQKQKSGVIINISSVSGVRGDAGFGSYSAAKAGLINYTRTLAIDHGKDGIRANVVCPCNVVSKGSTGENMEKQELKDIILPTIPLGRYCGGSDQAAAIAFLASDDAAYITGAVLPVDGGVTCSTGMPNFGSILQDI